MQKLKASFKCAYVFCTKVTLSLLLPFLCDTSGDLGEHVLHHAKGIGNASALLW